MLRRIRKFIHRVLHVMAAANPEHFAEIRQSWLGSEELPLLVFGLFPSPRDAVTIMPWNAHSAMIAEWFIPDNCSAKTIPGSEADDTIRCARCVPFADLG